MAVRRRKVVVLLTVIIDFERSSCFFEVIKLFFKRVIVFFCSYQASLVCQYSFQPSANFIPCLKTSQLWFLVEMRVYGPDMDSVRK